MSTTSYFARRLTVAAALLLPAAGSAAAQGSLSGQGFGYPSGQLGTRARGTGGAMAEHDAISTLNPAALGEWTRASLYVQYEPEFRQVTGAAKSDRATLIRFPLFAGALPVGERTIVGLSASTLLDRSWATQSTGTQRFDSLSVKYTDNFQSLGSITDLRLGLSRAVQRRLRLGVGLHAITGQNRLATARTFDAGQTAFAPFVQSTNITYTGSAMSLGMTWRPVAAIELAASAKRGGTLTASTNDTTIGKGRVPDRAGAGVRVEVATGTAVYARAERVWWSRLTPLSRNGGAGNAVGADSWGFGAGVEGRGPVLFSRPVQLRLGGDRRTLPFLAAGKQVTELVYGGGFGMPLAFGRSTLDVAVQRAARDANIAVKERAWTLSVGLTVRP